MSAGDSAFLQTLLWIQDSALGRWVTESVWALFFFLIVHTMAMGFLAGTGAAISLRTIGFARGVPLTRIGLLAPLMVGSLLTAVVSGVFLVVGYPGKALTNPVFYFKLVIVAVVLALTLWLLRGPLRRSEVDGGAAPLRAKVVAAIVIIGWISAITAGRYLAYTAKFTLLVP